MTITVHDLQTRVDTWIRTHDDYWTEFQILARLTEELGEVSGALQRQSGLRPRKVEVDLQGEVGDLLFTLAAFANKLDIDLTQSIEQVFAKYRSPEKFCPIAALGNVVQNFSGKLHMPATPQPGARKTNVTARNH